MSARMFKAGSRWAMLLLSLVAAQAQVGCAYPVMVQPSVAVSSRVGQFPVYAQVGVPGPMVVMPPRVGYAQPFYAAPVYRPGPGWGYGHRGYGGHGSHVGGRH
jgi:hypothetical protein